MNSNPTPYPLAWSDRMAEDAGQRPGAVHRFRNACAVDDQLSMTDATSRLIRECRPLGPSATPRCPQRAQHPRRVAARRGRPFGQASRGWLRLHEKDRRSGPPSGRSGLLEWVWHRSLAGKWSPNQRCPGGRSDPQLEQHHQEATEVDRRSRRPFDDHDHHDHDHLTAREVPYSVGVTAMHLPHLLRVSGVADYGAPPVAGRVRGCPWSRSTARGIRLMTF